MQSPNDLFKQCLEKGDQHELFKQYLEKGDQLEIEKMLNKPICNFSLTTVAEAIIGDKEFKMQVPIDLAVISAAIRKEINANLDWLMILECWCVDELSSSGFGYYKPYCCKSKDVFSLFCSYITVLKKFEAQLQASNKKAAEDQQETIDPAASLLMPYTIFNSPKNEPVIEEQKNRSYQVQYCRPAF
jgi:hypothetical protein